MQSQSRKMQIDAHRQKIHQHIRARTKKLFLWELINPFWMTGSLLFFGYTQTCWVWRPSLGVDQPHKKSTLRDLFNDLKKGPEKKRIGHHAISHVPRARYFMHTLLTHDSRLLMGHVWCDLSLMQFASWNVFLSLFDSLGSVWALFSAGMRFGDSSLQKVT